MKLDTFHGKVFVSQSHDGTRTVLLYRRSTYLQVSRQSIFRYDQRVIPGRGHRRRQSTKNGSPVVLYLAGLPMHEVCSSHHSSTERRADRLMAQADSQHWCLAGEMPDQFYADSSFLRRARSRRNYDAFRMHSIDICHRHLTITADDYLSSQF